MGLLVRVNGLTQWYGTLKQAKGNSFEVSPLSLETWIPTQTVVRSQTTPTIFPSAQTGRYHLVRPLSLLPLGPTVL